MLEVPNTPLFCMPTSAAILTENSSSVFTLYT